MAEEKVFLDEKGVKVTSARFITFGKTHSMSGVTAVSSYIIKPNRKQPIILAVIGLIITIFHWSGLILVAGAVAFWIMQKNKYTVSLSSASGSEDALTDLDKDFILRVVDALNDAIVHRG
ncbi:MAG: QacE [Bacteroidales bacterium]|nr:QacE [Bacteroidales bacterium]